MNGLADRVAVVTGAGKGIGRATALALTREGVHVLAVARTASMLETLRCEAVGLPGRCEPFAGDVTREEDVQSAFANAAAMGPVSILVNAAGAAAYGPTEDFRLDLWQNVLDVNLTGTFLCCREALRTMDRGHIINVASIAGHVPFPNSAAYCASKWGVVGLTRSLAAEVRASSRPGIHLTVLSPGSTDTPLWDQQDWSPPKEDMLRAEDVAATILHIVSAPPNATFDEVRLMPAKGIL